MDLWAEEAGLPALPAIDAIDTPTYRRFYDATVGAAKDPTAERLGTLGMLYDGYVMPDAALACYRLARDRNPTDFRWSHLIGIQLADRGELEEAVQFLLEALALEPRDVSALALAAELYLRTERYDLARQYFERYQEARPDDGLGSFGLAQVAEKSGDASAALTHLEYSLELDAHNRAAHYLAARILPQLGRTRDVEKHLVAAEALSGDAKLEAFDEVSQLVQKVARSQSYLRKGLDHFRRVGELEKALGFAGELAERRPEDLVVHQTATWLATVLRRYPEASRYARRAVELDPSFAPGWEAIARGLAIDGDNERALEAADRALAEDPSFTHARIVRGMALLQMGRLNEALANLKSGLADYPDDLDGHVILALALLQADDEKQARVHLERILLLDPNHVWARSTLERLRVSQGG